MLQLLGLATKIGRGCLILAGLLGQDNSAHLFNFDKPHLSYKVVQNIPGNHKVHHFKTIGAEEVPKLSKLDKGTMSIWIIQGRDPDIKSPPPFHVVVRVGDKVYNFDEKPGYPKVFTAAEFRDSLLKRPDKPIVQEIAFAAPADLMAAHDQHYQSLLNGSLKVDGKDRKYHYDAGGFGILDSKVYPNEEGKEIPMNCFSWVLSAWQQRNERNPVIEKWLKDHNIDKITREGSHTDAIREAVGGLGAMNVVTWGVDANERPGYGGVPGQHFDFLLNKVFRIRNWKDLVSVEMADPVPNPRPR